MSYRTCGSLALSMAAIGCITPGSALALTFNPIDRSLPLSIHARAGCLQGTISYPGNVSSRSVLLDDRPSSAACNGSVVQASLFSSDSASANVGAGTQRAVAIGRSFVDSTQALAAGASADAYLYDTLTVNGTWTGVKPVELRLTVDGSLTSNASSPNWQDSFVSSSLLMLTEAGTLLGNAGLFIRQGNNGIPFITSSAANVVTLTTNATNTVFDPADVQFTYSFVFLATTFDRTFSFMSRLFVSSAMGFATGNGVVAEGVIDFGNTAQFSLIVPDGVTVSSASGQFLTAVPEPATWWLLLLGLVGIMGRHLGHPARL